MKKIYLILSLCLAFAGITASAQTPTVSPAPVGGQWAEHTTWFFIKNGYNYYVSPAAGYADGSGFLLSNATKAYSNDLLWCIVGDEENGYKFYNHGAGTTKILGVTGSEASARTNMYDEASVPEGVTTTFDFTTSGYQTGNVAIKKHGTANDYFNRRGSYLALWNSTGAKGNDQGSAFSFTSVADELRSIVAQLAIDNANVAYFKLSDEKIQLIQNAVSGITSDVSCTEISELQEYLNTTERTNTEIANETKVLIGNLLHTTRYMGIKSGSNNTQVGSPTATSWTTVWTLKKTDDGRYKFYNEDVNKYVGAIPSANNTPIGLVDSEDEAMAYTLSASTKVGYCRIADLTFGESGRQNFHMVDWDGVVRWNESADASQFIIYNFTDETASAWSETLISSIEESVGKVGYPKSTQELETALANLKSNKTSRTAYHAVEEALTAAPLIYPEADKFYTIRNAKQASEYLVEDYDVLQEGNYSLHSTTLAGNAVPSLWKFEQMTDEGKTNLYNIKNANSGLYMSKANFGYVMRLLPKTETIGEFNLFAKTWVDVNGAVNLYDPTNDGTATVNYGRNDGLVVSWKMSGYQNNFFIEEATELPVTIGSSGYATLNLPFAVTIPEGVTAYTAEDNDDVVALSAIEDGVIPAGTPVILTAEPETYNFPIAYDNSSNALRTVLSGTTVPETINSSATAYILKDGQSGIGFYLVTSESDRTLPANKAYLGSTSTAVESKRLSINGNVTGLGSVETAPEADAEVYYDLSGRVVAYPSHGVYVKRSGEKVFIK
ncbi:MAG: hypothetical protein J1F06_03850 [Prevotellaceae bacterium]|nr:hypothetical protein [Prevotellaceae bacterium]